MRLLSFRWRNFEKGCMEEAGIDVIEIEAQILKVVRKWTDFIQHYQISIVKLPSSFYHSSSRRTVISLSFLESLALYPYPTIHLTAEVCRTATAEGEIVSAFFSLRFQPGIPNQLEHTDLPPE
ncbi:hypothetical protein OJAV_G00236140 [Oryzias javanicus]|uniref:Uncharacterized protein n=1 Tax=Oryzias javanicus TaxID=123683 RepID=A0A437BYA7_ORYJA|nr:hypothetical protein OJAV_G00236140 [Oryzias javanicus]